MTLKKPAILNLDSDNCNIKIFNGQYGKTKMILHEIILNVYCAVIFALPGAIIGLLRGFKRKPTIKAILIGVPFCAFISAIVCDVFILVGSIFIFLSQFLILRTQVGRFYEADELLGVILVSYIFSTFITFHSYRFVDWILDGNKKKSQR